MTRAALIASGSKELRALLPTWLACTLAVAAGALLRDPNLKVLAVLAYGFGSIAIGAHAVGHEYTHRTLGVLLSQPASRRGIYLVKFAVLATLLALLGFAASQALSDARELRWGSRGQVYLLVGLSGLFVAPALTMLGRSSIAGVVFTIAIPGLLAIVTRVAGFTPAVLLPAMFVICGAAALAGWSLFARLEAIEGRGAEIHLPQWLQRRSAASTTVRQRRHPVWRLVAKELHIHQMVFILAGLFALAIATLAALARLDPGRSSDVVLMTTVSAGALPFLIGSLASAEERQFGTLQWQQLLPMAAWQQWILKAGVAFALSLALAVGLPVVMATVTSTPAPFGHGGLHVLIALLLTSISLYVSSLNASGVRALLISIPVTIGAALAVHWISLTLLWFSPKGWLPVGRGFGSPSAELWGRAAAEAVMAALLLYFAYVNHRSAESPATQLRRQAGWLAGLLVFELSILILAGLR